MDTFIRDLLARRTGEQFSLHESHMNRQMVRVLRTIGYDRNYVRATGPYLYDEAGDEYLDLLSGFGVFALGRNHPVVNSALKEVLDAELPNLVQLDVSLLSGLLGEALIDTAPSDGLDRVFFANSGAETVEAAIKFARSATRRETIVSCDHAFHGLTYGALSLNGEKVFREGFGPFLGACRSVPFNDLDALEAALSKRDVAAFVVEPIQGKGVNLPDPNYHADAARLCQKYGTLFVVDEVQTGLGRTGKMWAIEHYGAEPDMLLTAKALSGGQVPVGAVLMRSKVFEAVFDRMDRAVVHGSTFAKNNLAMAAGLATLKVLKEDRLVEHAAAMGDRLIADLSAFIGKHEFVHAVRGKGLMIGIEFGKPKSFRLRTAWGLLEQANVSLFSQMILIPLFTDHRVLAQVASHGQHVIKLLPPLVIGERDAEWIVGAFDKTIGDCHKVPGAIWDLGRRLAGHAMARPKAAAE
ncbi:aspartate aminotransferase family protein [Acuticoccus sp. M5D2P5]|uniref:aspartate aminotransferase family protein n=1 Tax=Acuticoccus kalidii TaxID=2910977 RepID=UPI001F2C14B2|nr:aspartate aminotransferase family protein [Acuticoccus kalidii]MCF3931998.1 aspartate aminotransferase family protein [Acuticoccus kalidii]